MHKAIDIHSHMLCREWWEIFRAHSGPRFTVERVASGTEVVHYDGVPFMTPQAAMFDYPERFRQMDKAGVAMAVLSLTGPNVQWGDDEASTRAAREHRAANVGWVLTVASPVTERDRRG